MLAENMLAAFKGLFCFLPYLFSQLTLVLLFVRSKVSQYSQTMWYHQHLQQAGGPSLLRLQRLNNPLQQGKKQNRPRKAASIFSASIFELVSSYCKALCVAQ